MLGSILLVLTLSVNSFASCGPTGFGPVSTQDTNLEMSLTKNLEFLMVHTGLKPIGVIRGNLGSRVAKLLIDQGDLGVSLLPHLRWFSHDGNLVFVNYSQLRKFYNNPQYRLEMAKMDYSKADLLDRAPENSKDWVKLAFKISSQSTDTLFRERGRAALSGLMETPSSQLLLNDHPAYGLPSLVTILSRLDALRVAQTTPREILKDPKLLLQ
jgi:hypothetical protein